MSWSPLVPAGPHDLRVLWPAARAGHLFRSRNAFENHAREASWHVLSGSEGRAAVLDRWRDHLDILSIRALWVSERDIAHAVDDIRAHARAVGFERMLSPLVAEEATAAWRRAGLEITERIVVLRYDAQRGTVPDICPSGVVLRPARQDDLSSIVVVDAAAFDAFWAYEERRFRHAAAAERVVVAESAGRVVGYTLCTVERRSGTLGRLAVLPGERGRGIGSALISDAVRHMIRSGANSVSLCTQEGNEASLALYVRSGFRVLPGRLVFLIRPC